MAMRHLERARKLLSEQYAVVAGSKRALAEDIDTRVESRPFWVDRHTETIAGAELLIELLEEYIRKWESAREEVLPS